MPYPDFDAVDHLVHGAYASHGFVYTTSSGEEMIDEDAVKDAVYRLLLDNHVVSDESNRSQLSITSHELYEAIFPTAPGARTQPANLEEEEARNKISRKVWGYTGTGTTGHCQKRAEAEGLTLVLCEGPAARSYRSEETGRPKPTTEQGRFFTDDPDLIAEYSTLPSTLKLSKAADSVAKHMQMALRRHPELGAKVARQVSHALKQSQTALAPVADQRASNGTAAVGRGADHEA